ncbi:hypothetical protein BUALT_Bualt03G0127800 [Buddleja alternifolia]|uniref:S-locus receptor kinase C-terminal domain-containing protein n=1 Tax=Buddleja alternifolia TaxID=168488 RepID=A0AAV6Y4J3_9LAMI|nr:hypothetical protein BUALT_Bualt03G0127800 [Buddleja alternifolia]
MAHGNIDGLGRHAWRRWKLLRRVETMLVLKRGGGNFDGDMLIGVATMAHNIKDDKPSMISVVAMLNNEVQLPEANHPGFFTESQLSAAESSNYAASSTNEITITILEAQ